MEPLLRPAADRESSIIACEAAPAFSVRYAVPIVLGATAVAAGAFAARHYAAAGLTLAHYDAKAHLVVARRIFDSITPGYQQIGAVWLPLPHLLNAVFVQYDPWFRTGASAVAISVGAFGLAVFAAAALVARATGSRAAALVAALAVAINPNLLYLQSTPMTEPLLLGMTLLAVWMLSAWVEAGADEPRARDCDAVAPHGFVGAPPAGRAEVRRRPTSGAAGVALALACLTRYEAWPIVVAALCAAWFALWRSGISWWRAGRELQHVAAYPLWTVLLFLVHSRVTVGEWFVRNFFTPDNPARHDVQLTTAQVWWGVRHLSGPVVGVAMTLGAIAIVIAALRSRRRASWLVLVAPLAAGALPWFAFFSGHPYRIRYMVPVATAAALPLAASVGLVPRRWRAAAAAILAAICLWDLHPLDPAAPMIAEAQWDRPNVQARRPVIDCLARCFRPGEKIMASMGSLAHVMQETAVEGFALDDFLHEGNGDIWLQAIVSPRPYVEWIMIQEYAEGGDMLAHLARQNPAFLTGFTRECQGGGVVLYRRIENREFQNAQRGARRIGHSASLGST